jgi:hypothetical protein
MKRTTDVTYGGRIIPVPGYGMGGLHPPPIWEHGDPHPNVNIGALTLHPNENVGAQLLTSHGICLKLNICGRL